MLFRSPTVVHRPNAQGDLSSWPWATPHGNRSTPSSRRDRARRGPIAHLPRWSVCRPAAEQPILLTTMRRPESPTIGVRPATVARRRATGIVMALAVVVTGLASATPASASTSLRISWSGLSATKHYGIGIDWVYPDGTGPGGGYEQY